ncbi:hypothetical protein B0J12DRAFT_680079 [Macrophomina phaseolina]|uniref:Uncharacterized protein n=1 Tax=Macrophomina phaseolina TaxID=35725 RepID=A0ABQ8FXM3_9PEZI|nr:hypothetical protein B0J12DRAFT_680079 [Macrophomina phaseolina]
MEAVYDCIQRLNAIHNANLRVYPRREEWWQETRKMGDIQVLDKIAQGSYRPVTCFGQGLLCKLLDCEKTVYKRTQSGFVPKLRQNRLMQATPKGYIMGRKCCSTSPHLGGFIKSTFLG